MKIEITLTKAERTGIISYLKEVDEITENMIGTPFVEDAIEREIKSRLYHALRDQREAIADHISEAETAVLKSFHQS